MVRRRWRSSGCLSAIAQEKTSCSKTFSKITAKSGCPAYKNRYHKLRSYGAALRDLNIEHLHYTTNRLNNRAESSHVSIWRRERKMQRFKSHKATQIFLSIYGSIYYIFNTQRHSISRKTLRQLRSIAMIEWDLVTIDT